MPALIEARVAHLDENMRREEAALMLRLSDSRAGLQERIDELSQEIRVRAGEEGERRSEAGFSEALVPSRLDVRFPTTAPQSGQHGHVVPPRVDCADEHYVDEHYVDEHVKSPFPSSPLPECRSGRRPLPRSVLTSTWALLSTRRRSSPR